MAINLTSPSALIRELPAVLGFRPEQSLIVVVISNGALKTVLRVDLDDALATLGQLAEVTAGQEPDGVIAVIVDAHDGNHNALIDALDAALNDRSVMLIGAHVVDAIAEGGRWHCPDRCGVGGVLDDPAASVMAAAAVTNGRRLYSTRAELQAILEPDTAAAAALAEVVLDVPAATDPPTAVEAVIAAARAYPATGMPDTESVARIIGAMRAKHIRDMLFALALTADAAVTEALFIALARVLPPPWRADAAAVVGFLAYSRGDGPLAGIATGVALRDDPQHVLAGLLDAHLRCGTQPTDVRQLAEVAHRLAEEAGVALPERCEQTA
ncbi:hypothetical protein MycrhDRAFT_5489 [Mycolicibacterium rhodesiae JS60]|nr:hypothetical protein MycrhDRAFT_5489 [Mycolicibacterium rhodesiae JS60]